ncbi:B-cell differentiation antigen CD72 [Perognathus longimembris pacificus]|uniref:B-cell differentiation antigen CD72 n=1 Tax=Perognathus longimembris pacificus TaxID=214514 RepID=UPI002019629B|nr:B-cell differentiation antigen CD72 [Perognathus longimembris pacificus]
MAEAITYADLKFVKAPLKKSSSSPLEQDTEDYEDGELTYENVQVAPTPAGAPGVASSGLGDKARVKAEQTAKSWSCMKLSAGRVLSCPTSPSCLQYLLIGLLLICLLLGVAAICLGVRYLQLSQQFQQVTRVLEATNSSLRQQVRQRITQLGQQEEELQECRSQLAQSQEELQEQQRVHQATEGQLLACQLDGEKTKETLKREEEQRRALEQRLNSVQDRLKSSSICPTLDSCCPVGWKLHERRCFYFSHALKTWEDSRKHCTSLFSNLATFHEDQSSYQVSIILSPGTASESSYSFWSSSKYKGQWWIGNSKHSGSPILKQCFKVQLWSWTRIQEETCTESLLFICEQEAFRLPEEDQA